MLTSLILSSKKKAQLPERTGFKMRQNITKENLDRKSFPMSVSVEKGIFWGLVGRGVNPNHNQLIIIGP